MDYPFGYDPYVRWKGEYKENNHFVCSNELLESNPNKFAICYEEVFGEIGQDFTIKLPSQVNSFLNKYFSRKVKLTVIINCCDTNTGVPYWCFGYEEII